MHRALARVNKVVYQLRPARTMSTEAKKSHFFEEQDKSWEKCWQSGSTPWDTGDTVCPPLVQAVQTKAFPIKDNAAALIPGCGSGHECMFLRKNGFSKVVGLDLSPTAVKVAQANLEKEGNLDNVEYTCGSFFDWESKSTPTFDFIFDYTFFVAIDPSMRPTWAKSHARCLTPETGTLATLLFPLLTADGDSSKGPPYPVTLSMYEEVLTPLGFELVSVTKDVDSIKPRQGKEMMAYWKLKGAKSGE